MKATFTETRAMALSTLWILSLLGTTQGAYMSVGSFDGAVTSDEINSFNEVVTSSTPATSNIGNLWAQGDSGEMMQAINLIYLIGRQQTTLDQMIRYCDAVLSERNDLAKAPIGQYKIWTGDIAPVWPNDVTESPIATGGEQGDTIGHLASCANNILKNTTLYNDKPSIGDPHGYGETYLDRAKTYVKQADYSMTDHVLSRLLDLSNDNKMYFAKDSAYQPGGPVPWNQQMMFNYAFQNLASAHRILADNDTMLFTYKHIMEESLAWFFTGGGSTTIEDSKGNKAYQWDYSYGNQIEDANHADLDVAGFYLAYIDGNWGITEDQMMPFANTFVDIMDFGNGTYAGTVNGKCGTEHSACSDSIRSGFLLLADFKPDSYHDMMAADFTENGTTGSPEGFARFLWVKNQRANGK